MRKEFEMSSASIAGTAPQDQRGPASSLDRYVASAAKADIPGAAEEPRERDAVAGLKPCPFCGSMNIDPEGWASTDRAGPACDDCSGSADTVELWNTRPAEAEILAALQEFVAVCRRHLDTCGAMSADQAIAYGQAVAALHKATATGAPS